MYKTVILTVSDRCFSGEQSDESGPLIEETLPPRLFTVTERKIVPDDIEVIKGALLHFVGKGDIDLILTTGGTGFSSRDVTPEATGMILHKTTPGIDFVIYSHGLQSTPHAMLSRATSGIRHKTLIINLPGNPDAAAKYVDVLADALPHALDVLRDSENASNHRFEKTKNRE